MSNCLNCGKELTHIEGRRKKKYCNDNCRQAYWQKTHKKEAKFKKLPIEEYDNLMKIVNGVVVYGSIIKTRRKLKGVIVAKNK